MSPFKGLTWNEADRKATEESKKTEELETKLREHDYSECYCHALQNPPWGGYSIEEQLLFEAKQRRRPVGQVELHKTRKSRYSYRYANNALTGEIIIHDPFLDELFTTADAKAKREPANLAGSKVLTAATDMIENVSIFDSVKACTRARQLEELPDEILQQIISNLDPYDLGSLSDASRRLTILIGLVPCRDAFTWAVHRWPAFAKGSTSIGALGVEGFGQPLDMTSRFKY